MRHYHLGTSVDARLDSACTYHRASLRHHRGAAFATGARLGIPLLLHVQPSVPDLCSYSLLMVLSSSDRSDMDHVDRLQVLERTGYHPQGSGCPNEGPRLPGEGTGQNSILVSYASPRVLAGG